MGDFSGNAVVTIEPINRCKQAQTETSTKSPLDMRQSRGSPSFAQPMQMGAKEPRRPSQGGEFGFDSPMALPIMNNL
jgi:hypothetical protein